MFFFLFDINLKLPNTFSISGGKMAGNKGKRKQKDKNQERNYLQPVGSFFNEYVDKVLKKMRMKFIFIFGCD